MCLVRRILFEDLEKPADRVTAGTATHPLLVTPPLILHSFTPSHLISSHPPPLPHLSSSIPPPSPLRNDPPRPPQRSALPHRPAPRRQTRCPTTARQQTPRSARHPPSSPPSPGGHPRPLRPAVGRLEGPRAPPPPGPRLDPRRQYRRAHGAHHHCRRSRPHSSPLHR